MDDGDERVVAAFGQDFTAIDGRIRVQQTLTLTQVRELRDRYPEATSLQEAVRMAICEATRRVG